MLHSYQYLVVFSQLVVLSYISILFTYIHITIPNDNLNELRANIRVYKIFVYFSSFQILDPIIRAKLEFNKNPLFNIGLCQVHLKLEGLFIGFYIARVDLLTLIPPFCQRRFVLINFNISLPHKE